MSARQKLFVVSTESNFRSENAGLQICLKAVGCAAQQCFLLIAYQRVHMPSLTFPERTMSDIDANLMARFGSVMSTEEVAEALKITVPAIRMARSRKQFPLKPLDVKGRKGQIYNTLDVARLLASWISNQSEEPM